MPVINLDGSATDDGLPDPPSTLTYVWTKISGPGAVTFNDAANPITTAFISEPGEYVLRLTANDSSLTGFDELTITVEDDLFVPPLPGDPEFYYGDVQGYIVHNRDHVFRTWDVLAASPLWHLIDTGLTGHIWDVQYMHVDDETIGAWCITSTGIFFTPDLMASILTWSQKLSIADIQAEQVDAPVDTVDTFSTMAHSWLHPGHLCVATSLSGTDTDKFGYVHAYFWITVDYGVTWTVVDMDQYIQDYNGDPQYLRAYVDTSLYAMAASRHDDGIWCVRRAPRVGLADYKFVFYSADLGFSWTQRVGLPGALNNFDDLNLLHPFPTATSPSYITLGTQGVNSRLELYKSEDSWVTKSPQIGERDGTDPVNYWGYANGIRLNKRTFDDDHLIGWHFHAVDDYYHLLESFDRGVTWSLLYTDSEEQNVNNGPNGAFQGASHNTPNGWPPDVDQWFLVRTIANNTNFTTKFLVELTLDNFATTLDKSGDIRSLIPSWPAAYANGFALPKIAPNVEPAPVQENAVRVRVASSTGNVVGTSISITSTGVVEGDRVLLHLRIQEDAAPTGIPTDFTLVPNGEQAGPTNLRVYEKVATGSEPANYTFTFPSGNARLGRLVLYAEGGGTVTLDASASVNQTTGTSATGVCPSVTTTVPYTFLAVFWSLATGSSNPTAQSGMIKQYSASANGVHCTTQAIYSGAGATGPRQITLASGFPMKSLMSAWKVVP